MQKGTSNLRISPGIISIVQCPANKWKLGCITGATKLFKKKYCVQKHSQLAINAFLEIAGHHTISMKIVAASIQSHKEFQCQGYQQISEQSSKSDFFLTFRATDLFSVLFALHRSCTVQLVIGNSKNVDKKCWSTDNKIQSIMASCG